MNGVEFIELVHRYTSHGICLASYPNSDNRQGGKPVELLGRSNDFLSQTITRLDRPGYGVYFAMGSCAKVGEHRRAKECIREVGCVWCEIDFKAVQEKASIIVQELLKLTFPPSLIVHSGNGLHCYWLLSEAIDARQHQETLEGLMRTIASKLAGDKCWNIDRVLRVPGTTNTKDRDNFKEVKIVADSRREYELGDLIEAFDELRPVLTYRDGRGPAAEEDDNVWLRHAKEHGVHTPLDVDALLAAMAPGNIHNTLRDVSASLVSRGVDQGEIVDRLLAASRRACGGMKYFNERRERTKIERLCEGWQRKLDQERRLFPEKGKAAKSPNVVQLSAKRTKERDQAEDQTALEGFTAASAVAAGKRQPDVLRALARGALTVWRRQGNQLLRVDGDMHVYSDGYWRTMTRGNDWALRSLLQRGAEIMDISPKISTMNGAWKLLMEFPELSAEEKIRWNEPRYLNCANGVLDLKDGTFGAHSERYFLRYKLAIPFAEGAQCPRLLKVLDRTFAKYSDKAGIIACLQEFFGYSLFPASFDKAARLALFMYGPADTGKTLLASIHRAMLGQERIGSPTASQLGDKFGLEGLVDKVAWNRDEAVGEGDHLDAAIFKALVSGEPVTVQRKHQTPLECKFDLSVCLTMNSLPWSKEATKAMAVRLIVLWLNNVISNEERKQVLAEIGLNGVNLANDLIEVEGAGILNWALEGMRRLKERGAYALPQSIKDELDRFSETTNPAREWVETCLVEDRDCRVSKANLTHVYNAWFADQQGRGHRAVSTRTLMGMLRGILTDWEEEHPHGKPRRIVGWRITPEGVKYWKQAMKDMRRDLGEDDTPNEYPGVGESDAGDHDSRLV